MISIIVPVYNSGKYLKECIDSILNQTYLDFEAIFIDDGSTDNSIDIIKLFAENDSRIRFLSQKNAGPSCARNNGIRNANGEYIVFVDSDDIIDNNYLMEFVKYNELYGPNSLIITRWQSFVDNNNLREFKKIEKDVIELSYGEEFKLYEEYVLNAPYNKFFYKKYIDLYNISFDSNICIGEDLLFNIEYIKHVKPEKYIILPHYSYYYRRNVETSLTSKYISEFYEHTKYEFEKLIQLLEETGASSLDIKKCRMVKAEQSWHCLKYYYEKTPGTKKEKIKKAQEIIDKEDFSKLMHEGLLNNIVPPKSRWVCDTNNFIVIKCWFDFRNFMKKLIKSE